jgi:type 1 glutamine amidotransferase
MLKLLKAATVLLLLAGSMLLPGNSMITAKCATGPAVRPAKAPRFKVLVLAEAGGHHIAFTRAAKPWLDQMAADSNFSIQYIQHTDLVNEKFLADFRLFIQLDYPPYAWKPEAAKAFEAYINKGKGGWIGFHHATLLGEFDGFPMWQWFSDFMGGIRFKDYIAAFAKGKVKVEDAAHPVMKGIGKDFWIEKEEWYTYDKSPRPNVHVIASVDENTYSPGTAKKMGDHPVIWSNPRMPGRNVYIFMGHSPELFQNPSYVKLFRNAVSWASQR